ncbi:MAG: hypothetical protein ACT4PV_03615 [Planctomycetaceae bacterium]
MTRKDRLVLLLGALLGSLFGSFACAVAYAPKEEAARLFCRFTPVLDCYRSLTLEGSTLTLAGAAVLPLLAAFFLLQLGLCGAAAASRGARRDAALSWALACSLPVAGLSATLLLNDLLVAKATTPGGLGCAAFALWGCVRAASLRRGGALPFGPGAGVALALAPFALLSGFFLQGAGEARLQRYESEAKRAAEPPSLRWPVFARNLPREGAAILGRVDAAREALLVVDLADAASRGMLKAALHFQPDFEKYGGRVAVLAAAPHGAGLAVAQSAGVLDNYLKQLFAGEQDPATLLRAAGADPGALADPRLKVLLERRDKALAALEAGSMPYVITANGRLEGERALGQVIGQFRDAAAAE